MDSFTNTLKNVEFQAHKTQAEVSKKVQELTAANQQLLTRCDALESQVKDLTQQLQQNQKSDDFEKVRKKVDELSIGFEYIRLYGFQPNHFEEVLKAYKEKGQFPDPVEVMKKHKEKDRQEQNELLKEVEE